tara:strand:- start:193 stop:765 length:573 start_codon:yes stop_codon:yes gene_type:complete
MKTGIFYATNTGYTEEVADEISDTLGPNLVDTCKNIEDLELSDLQGFDVLILGIATWDAGDLPYDWALFHDQLPEHDFTGTRIVLFGLGDQVGYGETFLDAMGIIYRGFLEQGAIGNLGFWPTKAYDFQASLAAYDDKFCGLAIDQDNESHLTTERIVEWCAQIKRELEVVRLCSDNQQSVVTESERVGA